MNSFWQLVLTFFCFLALIFVFTNPNTAQGLRHKAAAIRAAFATAASSKGSVAATPETRQTEQKAFGYKTGWIAVRSTDRDAVIRALGLTELRQQEWQAGLSEAYDFQSRRVAVTPSVNGWVLVAGARILSDSFPPEPQRRTLLHGRMADLSKEFGEALLFATYRVSESHAWGRWNNGALVRLVSFNEGEVEQVGKEDSVEKAILQPDDEGFVFIEEENVMQVAAAWSVAPEHLDDLEGEPLKDAKLMTGLMP